MSIGQTEFRAALLDPAHERPAGLVDGSGRAAGRRFDVYRNNVAVSLTEALETAFPVIRKLLGEKNFRTVAGAFLRRHPPSSPLMMFYGEEMPKFLRTFEPTSKIGYLPDIARLELAIRESYHAADSEPVDPAKLQGMSPDDLMALRFDLAPSLRLIRSPWPIHAIWRFNTEESAPKPAMAAQDVAVLRVDLDPLPHLLPLGSGAFIEALTEGRTLGESVDLVAEQPGFDLTTTLALLLDAGAITSLGDRP